LRAQQRKGRRRIPDGALAAFGLIAIQKIKKPDYSGKKRDFPVIYRG
jgi:hypothetical protein